MYFKLRFYIIQRWTTWPTRDGFQFLFSLFFILGFNPTFRKPNENETLFPNWKSMQIESMFLRILKRKTNVQKAHNIKVYKYIPQWDKSKSLRGFSKDFQKKVLGLIILKIQIYIQKSKYVKGFGGYGLLQGTCSSTRVCCVCIYLK